MVSTFLAMPILTMLPAFATEVLTGGQSPRNAALDADGRARARRHRRRAARRHHRRGQHMGRILLLVQIGLGLLIAGFRACRRRCRSAWCCCFSAACSSWRLFSISFSLLQMTVPNELRGRVVSIYMVALRGGGPIGGLVAGALADKFSASSVMAVNGTAAGRDRRRSCSSGAASRRRRSSSEV